MSESNLPQPQTARIALLTVAICFLGLQGFATASRAQGGPPFRTDDPETPGNGHWEVNLGWIGERNAREGLYELPNLDLNYGWGNHVQISYELPLAMHETRGERETILAGTGESLSGVKWRFFEYVHNRALKRLRNDDATDPDLSFSTHPQLSVSFLPSSVRRGLASPGPQFLLPLEMNARLGPLRVAGEVGYWFTNHNVPQSWIRGLMVGREFSTKTEAYIEIYDQQDANRVNGEQKQRGATIGVGGRRGLNRRNSLVLLLMGGRSFQSARSGSGQPSWIAYSGVQILLGPREKN